MHGSGRRTSKPALTVTEAGTNWESLQALM
jgi:hypothetical protein